MTTTAIQQEFNIDFSSKRFDDEGEMSENMCESSESSSSSNMTASNVVDEGGSSSKYADDESHVYANVREIEELHKRMDPPIPSKDDMPLRDMHNGWFEFETDHGRTYFYHKETGKSQWIPPRFIRTPAQVEAFLKATRTAIDESCTFEGTSTSSSVDDQKENEICSPTDIPITNEIKTTKSDDVDEIIEEEVFDEVCDEPPAPFHNDDDEFSDEFEESTEDASSMKPVNQDDSLVPQTSLNRSELMSSRQSLCNNLSSKFSDYVLPPDSIEAEKSVASSSPKTRSVSFQNKCSALKNVSFGHKMTPSFSQTPDRPLVNDHQYQELPKYNERRESSETREPVRTIRYGDLEWYEIKDDRNSKKREWSTNYMYLTSAHLILYKDQKSAEKHGKHYDAPLCVWDLRGAKIGWHVDKDVKKRRKYIELELCNSSKYVMRSSHESVINDWLKALEEVVAKLPSPGISTQPVIDANNVKVCRNPSYIGARPLSHALLPINRSIRRRDDPMSQSAIESSSTTAANVEESRPSKETILEKLRRFFRTRPTVELLKERGIYKPEPVFGSTLSAICQRECSLVPKFIRVITEVIESKGLDSDGIYRVSGNLSAVQKIRCQADQDNYKALVAEEDIHVLTGALKLFFRELSEPLFPTALHKEYTSAMQTPNATTRFKKFEELLSRLPAENRETLKMLLRHLNRVAAHSSKNRMQQHNLAIVFGPTLFHNGDGAPSSAKNKKVAKKGKPVKGKDDAVQPVQSNSHLAFSMIMQSQIVQYLLESQNKFEILKAPVNIGR